MVYVPSNIELVYTWWGAAHHGGEAGDEADAVLDLLLRHLHHRAVLLLQRQGVGAMLGHPQVQL